MARSSSRRSPTMGLAYAGVALVFLLVTSCVSTKVRGGLSLVMSTDGTLAPDALVIDITSPDGQTTYRSATYEIPAETTLPTSLTLESLSGSVSSASITVSVWAGGVPLDVRQDRVIQIPSDRLAVLHIVFSAKCTPDVTLSGGVAVSRCSAGETCDPASGSCVTNLVSFGSDGGAPGSVSRASMLEMRARKMRSRSTPRRMWTRRRASACPVRRDASSTGWRRVLEVYGVSPSIVRLQLQPAPWELADSRPVAKRARSGRRTAVEAVAVRARKWRPELTTELTATWVTGRPTRPTLRA